MTYSEHYQSRRAAIEAARLTAEQAADAYEAHEQKFYGISRERLPEADRIERTRLMQEAESTYGSYAELRWNTQ